MQVALSNLFRIKKSNSWFRRTILKCQSIKLSLNHLYTFAALVVSWINLIYLKVCFPKVDYWNIELLELALQNRKTILHKELCIKPNILIDICQKNNTELDLFLDTRCTFAYIYIRISVSYKSDIRQELSVSRSKYPLAHYLPSHPLPPWLISHPRYLCQQQTTLLLKNILFLTSRTVRKGQELRIQRSFLNP